MSPASKKPASHPMPLLRRLRLAAAVVATLGATAGCIPETTQWSPAQAIHRNEVRYITFEHDIQFAGPSSALSPSEEIRLNSFLSRHDAGYGDEIFVGALGQRDGNGADMRADRREAAVRDMLRERNLASQPLHGNDRNQVWNGSVRLVIGRYVVIPPRCPDWSKESSSDASNSPTSNLGCATETNLGLMVANPADLVRGRSGPSDGAIGARRYREFREGKQKELKAVTPLVIQSGSGAQ